MLHVNILMVDSRIYLSDAGNLCLASSRCLIIDKKKNSICSLTLMNDSSEMTIIKHVMSGRKCRYVYIETELSTSCFATCNSIKGL